ncbi:TIGR02270 family protein [Myxococcus sp. RHSTA-1-4]|uniref:TIGR02270 family protein n=1 Tax=Myxococcus sp. RHSTA-1-4 TaxID=2874601 RepID=UPI001CBCB5F5|nr:TIGR02270 family protein [Myxococcus sp. RHSTA-1-4]MBZ4420404.1 TIGR02270 family protein [Myxococcus sp. RHSTA-1-4]
MSPPGPLPPNGPLPDFVSRHFEEASFLWTLRHRAIDAAHYTFADLERLDERVEAHLDGLRIAGAAAEAVIDEALSVAGAGEIFASAALALESGSTARLSPVLELARDSDAGLEAFVSAHCWLPWPRVAKALGQLAHEDDTVLCQAALAGHAAHGQDPGAVLPRALSSTDAGLRARALQVVGELRRRELLPVARQALASEDEACRFFAARACVLLGERAALSVLRSLAGSAGAHAAEAVSLAVRRMERGEAREWLMGFTERPEHRRLALAGSAALGDTFFIPWLLRMMRVPELARAAGEAFRFITGADLSERSLEGTAPEAGPDTAEQEDETPEAESDADLPWPAPDAVAAWWAERKRDYHPETRYLLGRPMTPEALREVLGVGRQRERRAAALELAMRHPGQPLFDIKAPGFRQRQWLAALQ